MTNNYSTFQLFNLSAYKNLKVFVTGHTGFKGGWLCLWLKSLGANVLGYSLMPNTQPSLFNIISLDKQVESVFGDILDREKLEKTMIDFNPDIVFHLAAQPLVRLSYSEPVMTYETNVLGTLNVLEAARKCPNVKAFINVTTDKCYENKEINRGYEEHEPMGGHDMYSSSKGCVEIMSASYRRSFLLGGKPYAMATARAGNVIGGGDWALDRLIPDCIRTIENYTNEDKKARKQEVKQKNESALLPSCPPALNSKTQVPIVIRNPHAVRPWQHVLEPLSGYLLLGEKLLQEGAKYAEGFNFGPHEDSVLTVADVAQRVINYYGKGEVVVHKKDDFHEAGLLMLNIEKAKRVLGWTPAYTADKAIKETVEWYKRFYANESMLEFSINQIKNYEKNMQKINELAF